LNNIYGPEETLRAQEHLIEQMPLLPKPGISFRTLELSKKGQGKETLILQSGPRLSFIQRW